jgi:hypothetical protein
MATRLTEARLRQIIREEATRVRLQELGGDDERSDDDGTFAGALSGALRRSAEKRIVRSFKSDDPEDIPKAQANAATTAIVRAAIKKANLTSTEGTGATAIHEILQQYFGLTPEAAAMVLGSILSSI